jgi:hypothetical protein
MNIRPLALALCVILLCAMTWGRPASAGAPAQRSLLLGIQARNVAQTVRAGAAARYRVKDPAELRAQGRGGPQNSDRSVRWSRRTRRDILHEQADSLFGGV